MKIKAYLMYAPDGSYALIGDFDGSAEPKAANIIKDQNAAASVLRQLGIWVIVPGEACAELEFEVEVPPPPGIATGKVIPNG